MLLLGLSCLPIVVDFLVVLLSGVVVFFRVGHEFLLMLLSMLIMDSSCRCCPLI